jgi:hypothetical protein
MSIQYKEQIQIERKKTGEKQDHISPKINKTR